MVKIDIEMPTYCYDCPCHNGENGRCNITGDSVFDKRPFDCPLKEEKAIQIKRFIRKPTEEIMGMGDCPMCGGLVVEWGEYCSHCGQRLDWGDEK